MAHLDLWCHIKSEILSKNQDNFKRGGILKDFVGKSQDNFIMIAKGSVKYVNIVTHA